MDKSRKRSQESLLRAMECLQHSFTYLDNGLLLNHPVMVTLFVGVARVETYAAKPAGFMLRRLWKGKA